MMDDPDNPLGPGSSHDPSQAGKNASSIASDNHTPKKYFDTPFTQKLMQSLVTPRRKRNSAGSTTTEASNSIGEDTALTRWSRRVFRFFFVCCDAVLYVLRPFTRVYLWVANVFIFLLLARYVIIAYGGAVSYACGKPLIHAFLCPSLNLLSTDIDDGPAYVFSTANTHASTPKLVFDGDSPSTFGQVVGEIETTAWSMLSLVRRSPSSPRTAEMEDVLGEIIRVVGLMGPGAFSYQQGMARTVDDVMSLGAMNLATLEAHSGSTSFAAPDGKVGEGPRLGAAQPVSDNLEEISNEGERQVLGATHLKELFSKLGALIQEEISDTEQQSLDLSRSMWTRLGGNQHQLKHMRFWRKALKRIDKLGEDLLIYATNLKSTYATSKAKVDDLQQRVQGLYMANGMPFSAKWQSIQAAVSRMWAHGGAGVAGVAQNDLGIAIGRIADH